MENNVKVRTFVGIDAHSRHCSIKAIDNQGGFLLEVEIPTTRYSLRKALAGLPGPVWVMLESSAIAPFVKDCIQSCVDRTIVCETRENRWIAKSEDKGDDVDADRLARLVRMGEFKEVHVPRGLARDRRELVSYSRKAVGNVNRLQSRIKSKYREHGFFPQGGEVYGAEGRKAWLAKIKRSHVRLLLEILYEEFDASVQARDAIFEQLRLAMCATREYKHLKTMPGVGPVTSAILVGVIDDPHRFDRKNQLWKYSGLGVVNRWSADSSRAKVGGSRSGNRLMKYAAMTAAKSATGDKRTDRFSRHYRKMVGAGVKPSMARRTVARNILATALAMMKSGQVYRESP